MTEERDEAAGQDTPEETQPEAAEAPAAEAPEEAAAEAPAEEPVAEAPAEEPAAEEPAAEAPAAEAPAADAATASEEDEEFVETPRVKPEIPGMDLEVDIVREGEEALREDDEDLYGDADSESSEEELTQPIADAAIDLAAGARYTATGKRKTAVARVILKPGTGAYEINGRTLDVFFPRPALQRTIRTALETVGLEEKIDVVAAMHGGGVSAQAGALRHAISKALVDADPNLRSELKRRGFLTRDARVKERKKAGLKKARKRPQFSKR
jgi:small subunit ribosomal protein S9